MVAIHSHLEDIKLQRGYIASALKEIEIRKSHIARLKKEIAGERKRKSL